LGIVLDDWQAWVLDGMLSEDENSRLCASTSVLVVPRQNGKNAVLEALELYAFFVLGLRRILHTAHLTDTSAEHMQRLRDVIDDNPDLRSLCEFHTANGKERITRTDTGATIKFVTRSKKTGRGSSPQLVVFDEALQLTEQHVQAIVPALSAQSMRDDKPLTVYTSSAPLPESSVLNRLRRSCIDGFPSAFFAEWSCDDEGLDHRDRERWYEANPALGIRISEEYIAENELAVLSREAFLIERLGVVPGDQAETGVIPLDKWRALVDMTPPPVQGVASLAVGPGGMWAALGFATVRPDGLLHVEVARHEPGTAWVVESARRAFEETGLPLVVDPKTETAGLIDRLVDAGVEVRKVSGPEWVAACLAFQSDVQNLQLRHRDQAPLNASVLAADIRPAGEAWVFRPRVASMDMTPLFAAVLAASSARRGDTPAEAAPMFFSLADV
jgi:phage terminase large subunit-like protein